MAFCSQADLELAVGGARELVQLADPDGTGSADPARVTDYLESGAAEVRTAAEVKHDPEVLDNLDAPSARRLRDANAALSARIAYTKGGRAAEVPEFVERAADRAETFLDQLARGERRLGRVAGGTVAAINQPVGLVDHDARATGISISAFRRGFR